MDAQTLMTDFVDGANGTRDVDMAETLHAIIADVCDSYRLAIESVGGLSVAQRDEITKTVSDYVANHYGD